MAATAVFKEAPISTAVVEAGQARLAAKADPVLRKRARVTKSARRLLCMRRLGKNTKIL